MSKPEPLPSLFDDALNPPAAPPLATPHEPVAKVQPKPAPAAKPSPASSSGDYNASSIEVLEGLEPVRMRPGMYIGGTDERALHHLFAEVLDNAMDEAVAGHAKVIEVTLNDDGSLTVRDDGRGIPVDPHPKHPGKSALEVVMTVLHSGGKFSDKAYSTAGGLHGVGVSVVNALSDLMTVQVALNKELYEQSFSRGIPRGPIQKLGPIQNRRGTNQGPYSMSKYAALSMTEALEHELEGTNIGVSVLCPGPIATNIARIFGGARFWTIAKAGPM